MCRTHLREFLTHPRTCQTRTRVCEPHSLGCVRHTLSLFDRGAQRLHLLPGHDLVSDTLWVVKKALLGVFNTYVRHSLGCVRHFLLDRSAQRFHVLPGHALVSPGVCRTHPRECLTHPTACQTRTRLCRPNSLGCVRHTLLLFDRSAHCLHLLSGHDLLEYTLSGVKNTVWSVYNTYARHSLGCV